MLAWSRGLDGTCQISLLKSCFFSPLKSLSARSQSLNSVHTQGEGIKLYLLAAGIPVSTSWIIFLLLMFSYGLMDIYFILWNLSQHVLVCVVAQFVKISWFHLCLSLWFLQSVSALSNAAFLLLPVCACHSLVFLLLLFPVTSVFCWVRKK